jgi:hypothetical protein
MSGTNKATWLPRILADMSWLYYEWSKCLSESKNERRGTSLNLFTSAFKHTVIMHYFKFRSAFGA